MTRSRSRNAQGLLTSKNEIMFHVGKGTRRFSVSWDDQALYKLLYAFVYRLYVPGDFRDPSYVAKRRLGLRQVGSPIMDIRTLKGILELVFDVLDGILLVIVIVLRTHMFVVLRYLPRYSRQILHRDISRGNVLYMEGGTTFAPAAGNNGADMKGVCFIKYLLDERYEKICVTGYNRV